MVALHPNRDPIGNIKVDHHHGDIASHTITQHAPSQQQIIVKHQLLKPFQYAAYHPNKSKANSKDAETKKHMAFYSNKSNPGILVLLYNQLRFIYVYMIHLGLSESWLHYNYLPSKAPWRLPIHQREAAAHSLSI